MQQALHFTEVKTIRKALGRADAPSSNTCAAITDERGAQAAGSAPAIHLHKLCTGLRPPYFFPMAPLQRDKYIPGLRSFLNFNLTALHPTVDSYESVSEFTVPVFSVCQKR